MYAHANPSFDDSQLLLDEEFDRTEINLAPEHSATNPGDDLAWEDQLDEGVEMSL